MFSNLVDVKFQSCSNLVDFNFNFFQFKNPVLSWWCLDVLDYIVLYLIVLHLTLVRNVDHLLVVSHMTFNKWEYKVKQDLFATGFQTAVRDSFI